MEIVKSEFLNKVLRVRVLKEELVFTTSSFVLDTIEKMIKLINAEELILDLSKVSTIDSSAVGMFISLKTLLDRSNKKFILEGLTESVRRTLRLLDIANFLIAA